MKISPISARLLAGQSRVAISVIATARKIEVATAIRIVRMVSLA